MTFFRSAVPMIDGHARPTSCGRCQDDCSVPHHGLPIHHEQGTAVVVVTHDHRSLDVFDATYTMEDGRLSGATRPSAARRFIPESR